MQLPTASWGSFPMEPEPDTGGPADRRGLPVYHHAHAPGTRSTLIAKREERGSSEQRPSSLKKSLDFMNVHIQAGGCDCGLFNSWCNSSCFWPLTWTIPIQPTLKWGTLVFLHSEPSNRYEEVLACSTFTCINWHIPRVLHLPNVEMCTGENWVECSTCKECYHQWHLYQSSCCFS